jgi:hypothetical protein
MTTFRPCLPDESAAPLSSSSFSESAAIASNQDGGLDIAAALAQVLNMNHAANENLDHPDYDHRAAEKLTPSTKKAFNTYIDQSQFHEGISPPKQSATLTPQAFDRRFSAEELERITFPEGRPLRTHTPPPPNIQPLVYRRSEGDTDTDQDMLVDEVLRPVDNVFLTSPGPNGSDSIATAATLSEPDCVEPTEGPEIDHDVQIQEGEEHANMEEDGAKQDQDGDQDEEQVEEREEPDNKHENEGDEDEDEDVCMSGDRQGSPAKGDEITVDDNGDVRMSDPHPARLVEGEEEKDTGDANENTEERISRSPVPPPSNSTVLPPAPSAVSATSSVRATSKSKSPVPPPAMSTLPPRTKRPIPRKSYKVNNDELIELSDGESELTELPPSPQPNVDTHAEPAADSSSLAKTKKARRSVAKPAQPEPIPGRQYVMKGTLQGTLHSNVRGPATMVNMPVTPVCICSIYHIISLLTAVSPDRREALHLHLLRS